MGLERRLRICCWVILSLAVCMTVFVNLYARDSVIPTLAFLPIALLPYAVLAFTVRRSRTLLDLVSALLAAVISLGLGCSAYHEYLFVNPSTLNAGVFVAVPLQQMLPVAIAWVVVRWLPASPSLSS